MPESGSYGSVGAEEGNLLLYPDPRKAVFRLIPGYDPVGSATFSDYAN